MSNYVTEALGRALLDLMREKSIEKITVDELTTRAKLGRATYFRNFNAKEEIITQYTPITSRAGTIGSLFPCTPTRASRAPAPSTARASNA